MATGIDNSRTNLIINYLPQTLSDAEFNQLFSAIGPLQSSRILRDKRTGYSFGYGFVNYQNEEDALKAIDTLNGLQLMHKYIKVAYARPPTDEIRGANLYVANLPKTISQDGLKAMFSPYGEIVNVKILMDNFTGQSKGCGFVLFAKKTEADAAMVSLNGTQPEGATQLITVKKAKDDNDRSLGTAPAAHAAPAGAGAFYGAYPGMGVHRGGGSGGAATGGPIRRIHGQYRFNPTQQGANNASPNITLTPPQNGGGFILFVYNIGPDADESLLYSLFSPFGAVSKVNVIKEGPSGKGKGYGFVTMVNHDEANFAIRQLDGYMMGGKPLQVSFKK